MAASPAKLDVRAPALFLAPHLRYPTRNRADIYADRIACALSRLLSYVDVLAEGSFVKYEQCEETSREIFSNAYRTHNMAALRTLFKRGHYLRERFVTPAFVKRARELAEETSYGTIVCSYIATASLLDLERVRATVLALTHNDEFRWFENMTISASIPAARSLARRSIEWLNEYLRENSGRLTLVHVTDEDRTGYEQRIVGLRHAIAPVGVDLPRAIALPLAPNTRKVTLLFAGSLETQTNVDALNYFSKNLFPPLSTGLEGLLTVVIAGSSPTASVRALADSNRWELWEDVPEHVLEDLYLHATFAILPFPYATSVGLKFLKALSYGVPVLSTPVLAGQMNLIQSPGFMSEDPAAWQDHIQTIQRYGITAEDRENLRRIATEHSWSRSASMLTGVDITDT